MKYLKPLALLGVLPAFAAGCASVHPGNSAKAETANAKIPLKVSAELGDRQDGQGYALIYVTFENVGDRWAKITETNVKFANGDASKLSVVVGQDLVDWASAVETTRELEKHNRSVVETALLIAGGAAVIGAGGHDGAAASLARGIGAAAVVGTGAYMVGNSIADAKHRQERTSWVPEHHLYQPFAVPAKLFVRRWILINKPASENLKTLAFEVKTAEGEKEVYNVSL